jgi:tRNA A37 N6-isopentenylltransferase MiaA
LLFHSSCSREVAKIYSELVLHDDAGKIQGVRYDELAPMLLKELQKQQATISAQAEILQNVQRQLAALTNRVQPPDGIVASR